MKRDQLIVLGAASALLLGAAIALAQDAVKTQPDNNKVLFENDRVRVIDVPVTHTAENMGKSPVHAIVVELKK